MSASAGHDHAATVLVVVDPTSSVANESPVRWSVDYLAETLEGAGVVVRRPSGRRRDRQPDSQQDSQPDSQPDSADVLIRVAGGNAGPAESFELSRPDGADGQVSVAGADARGLAYGVLELADRVRCAEDPVAELRSTEPESKQPATPVRSILRTFTSDVEDKPWFYDRDFWSEYLTELAVNRINRFQLAFGMQYNYGHHPATENYFCFPYPFLLDVPGFDVGVGNVPAEEREANLATLRYISDEAKRRGIHFQLGLWNHADDQGEGSAPLYPVSGITPDNHAAYCAAALDLLLRECPSIDGLTMRVHYEGGIPEPDHEAFWQTVMGAVAAVGRPIEIDMHAKGVDEALLDIARGTGCRVVVSAKYWAEHQGLPYHQTTIRERERATKEPGTGLMAITAHQRRFTRYGYGDFLREGSDVGLLFRIWPGTQKVLLWADPVLAAGYGRLGTIGGALGIEWCEPLSFKGRKNTGEPNGRDPYADPALRLDGQDWRKYRYSYRLWGRLLYDPDADPEQWRRFLRAEFGDAAEAVENALAPASRVLPLVTVVHGIGASNNGYWPEMYLNMPIAGGPNADHYRGDTASPPTFGGVSSFDPSMFYRVDEYAEDVVAGRRDGRYSPMEVADWLDRLAEEAEQNLAVARDKSARADDPEFRRVAIDVAAQAGLGRFFAGKFRAGVAYALHERTGDASHLGEAVAAYRAARDAWAGVAEVTTGAYRPDLTFGDLRSEHGHWADRLPAIEEDLADLERRFGQARTAEAAAEQGPPLLPAVERIRFDHTPPPPFARGEEVRIELTPSAAFDGTVVCHYRHLNQGEDFRTVDMSVDTNADRGGDGIGTYGTSVGGNYTDSDHALVYYFTVHHPAGDAWILPGLDQTLANQPYHVIRQRQE
ncbi:hypothetical protein [Actinopolymorpha singaporensis]|uniref:Uncharacterized protein n=1 Tax=Actinopolymorpha singaporensis TaxID=117157 RepID=A0A1H1R512_9ACTN|nr:hypothetical protein [Actinopolymorpha singaporensis]SDS30695.1 hypothetical protein SAMN04489717_2275 [Actinopolymorpha singaporensis]